MSEVHYPCVIEREGSKVWIGAEGFLLKYLRQHFYSTFARMYRSGVKGCDTWYSLIEKLASDNGFIVRPAKEGEISPEATQTRLQELKDAVVEASLAYRKDPLNGMPASKAWIAAVDALEAFEKTKEGL